MKQLSYNGKKYRCVHERDKTAPYWCGRWEFWYENGQRWCEVLNYNIKSKLNKISAQCTKLEAKYN